MIIKQIKKLFGNIPVRFKSDYAMEESVRRLTEATNRSIFSSFTQQSAVGPVEEDEVRLQRVIPFFGNSFKPIFVGKFVRSNSEVFLDGRFTMFWFSKLFMSFWFGFTIFWTIMATKIIISKYFNDPSELTADPVKALFPLFGVAFFIVGILFVRFSWWLSRKDITYLSDIITTALSKIAPNTSINTDRG